MTLQEAIKQMTDFYRAVEAVYAGLSKDVSTAVDITDEVKELFNDYLAEVGDAVSEANDAMNDLEKMQDVGVNCRHCKFYRAPVCNACRECMFLRLSPYNQKKPLNYEPI